MNLEVPLGEIYISQNCRIGLITIVASDSDFLSYELLIQLRSAAASMKGIGLPGLNIASGSDTPV